MTLDRNMQGNENSRSHLSLVTAARREQAEADAGARSSGNRPPSPFSAAVPDRYFETAALRDCHARIARAALDSDTVAVVEGEPGCGKTTFARILQQRVGASRDLCFIDVRIPQGERYLFDCLRRDLGAGPTADEEALTAQLLERGRHGDGCLIVVDDADRFSVFALRRLFALKRAAVEAGSRVGVVVTMSSLRLDALLALPSFAPHRARGLTRVELPHFSAPETAAYLRARVESAGLAATIGFDDAQVQRIHQASGGLPRQIKRVAGELLDGASPKPYLSARRQQRRAHIRHTLIPVALVVVPLVCIGLLLRAIFQRPGDDVVMERIMSTAGIEAAGTAVPLSPPPAASGTVDRAPEPARAPPDKASPAASARPAPPALSSPSGPPAEMPVAAATPAASDPPPQEMPRSPQAASPKPAPASAAAAKPDSAPAAAAPEPKRAPVGPAVALDGNAWLRAQNPAHYTLQLAGSEDRRDVDQFLEKYALPGRAVVVEVLRNGKIWYMVLYNSYPTWGEARRELGTLPPQLNRNNPFARRFASVQAIAPPP